MKNQDTESKYITEFEWHKHGLYTGQAVLQASGLLVQTQTTLTEVSWILPASLLDTSLTKSLCSYP